MPKRTAIAVHHTGTSEAAWDGPAAKTNLKLNQDAGYYEQAYAWKDSAGDPTNKSSYKFIHHEVSSEGAIGAANIKACQTAIGVLNGARGGTVIPSHDRQGVYNHLAAHLKDAKIDAPPLRAASNILERRVFGKSEFRVTPDGKSIEGHAAVFNSPTDIAGMFNEQVMPGAFSKTIQENDIRALFNHDPNFVLGRNKAGTLKLSEDKAGLAYQIDPPNAQWAQDLMESMKRGDISQSSFGFNTIRDEWDYSSTPVLRSLAEVRLFDVSPVTFPAYEDTDAGVRAMLASIEGDEKLSRALFKLTMPGATLSKDEIDLIRTHVGVLEERLQPNQDSPKEPAQKTWRHSLEILRLRLQLAEQDF